MDKSNKIGERTEAIILAELLRSGYVVLQPFGNTQRYDMVIDEEGKFQRIQCKTARIRNGCVKFATSSTHLRKGRKTEKRDYRGQIEYFGVYCPDNDSVYMVPVDDVGKSAGCLRVEKPKNNSCVSTIIWADKYRI